MNKHTIGFIGLGHMGASLIAGLIRGQTPANNIIASDRNPTKCTNIHNQFGINAEPNNSHVAQNADIIILSVRPQQIKDLLTEITPILAARKALIISIAAGIETDLLKSWLPASTPLIRAMPNVPAILGAGISALFSTATATTEHKNQAESILRAVGSILWIENETQLNTITALSGSGPGVFFLVMDSLIKAGMQQGLSEKEAFLLTVETALGAAKMALSTNVPLDSLLKQVCSKGGTTERMTDYLLANNLPNLLNETIAAGKERAKSITESFNQ